MMLLLGAWLRCRPPLRTDLQVRKYRHSVVHKTWGGGRGLFLAKMAVSGLCLVKGDSDESNRA